MRNGRMLWIVALIIFTLDIYIFQVVKFFAINMQPKAKLILYIGYWLISILSLITIFLLPTLYPNPKYKLFITYAFAIVVGLFFFKIIATAFFLVDDIRRIITWIILKISPTLQNKNGGNSISRSAFISWLGLGVGGTMFGSLLLGFSNKYNYGVRKIKLSFANLPDAFNGFKIVQLSDIHSGSFSNVAAVEKGVQKVIDQKADLILFTGDLVNDIYTEMDDYKSVFSKLKAPFGIFSTLGNHDYGDYYDWEDRDEAFLLKQEEEKKKYIETLKNDFTISEETKNNLIHHYRLYSPLQQNHLNKLKEVHKEIGWNLMMNENTIIEKNNEKIALLGIENWGARGNFPKYGRLDLASKGVENVPFKILMSHDPSHWDAQITTEYKDIDLTLSGHTHGMQFGVEIPFLKWSPIQYFYKQWAGIYQKENQKLYVNRGFGFLGYPGRVGIMPEITVIELTKA